MAIYAYKGINKQGKEVQDTVNADGLPGAKQKVKSLGIMLLEISEEKASTKKKKGSGISFGSGVSINDLSLMTRQLATLIRAKIQIVECLDALTDQVENQHLKIVLSEIKQKVNEGISLSKAMSEHPKIFNNVYVNMVEAGETSGTLEIVLLRLAEFTEAQVKLKNRVKGAMTYPVIMSVVGFIMMNIIFIFVIPKITKIFISMKKELPLQTKICIGISDFLQNYWWLVIVGIFATIYITRSYISTQQGERNWHKIQLKIPIMGTIIKMINVARFCSTLATLLNSGVPILAAMNIVKNLVPNVWMKDALVKAKDNIKEGGSMAPALIESGYFPPMVTHMIKLGERSGEIEPMLQIVSENYESQVDSKLTGLTSILEPIMMVVLGLAVAFIVFAVVVPMMELNSIKH